MDRNPIGLNPIMVIITAHITVIIRTHITVTVITSTVFIITENIMIMISARGIQLYGGVT